MPIPKKRKNETNQKFVNRCMTNKTMKEEFSNTDQRLAICLQQSGTPKTKGSLLNNVYNNLYNNTYGSEEFVKNLDSMYIPADSEYEDFGEKIEIIDLSLAKYMYKNPKTNEIYYFDRKSSYKKDGVYLIYISKAAEYQGRKVTLNKPFRTPKGPKKFSVYVKNDKGNIVKVNFGDPNMKIKKNIPERRKSFRARHNCDNPGPKWKARYWSCKAW
jgi:hypothetical protein